MIAFETGNLTTDQLAAILDSLPIEITFVDDMDTVRYFNQPKVRIFPRTKDVIGRKVQGCHSEKSISMVKRILKDLKHGKSEVTETLTRAEDNLVCVCYLAVRDQTGGYLGCLEVTQDVSHLRELNG